MERRRELVQLRRRLADLKTRYAATRRKEADLLEQLAAADLNLQIRMAERRVVELKQVEVTREAARAGTERDAAAHEVGGLRTDLGFRIGALYRMGRLGYLRTLAGVDSGLSFLRSLQTMSYIARRDALLIRRYQSALATLGAREAELSVKRNELTALAEESRKKEQETVAARAEKASLLVRVQRTSEEERTAVARLEEKANRLASLLDLLETRGRALPPGEVSIRQFRGVLDWPAKGAVSVPFGRIANPRFPKTFLRSSGWTISLPEGSEVRAIFAGDVVFSQWLKGYGNIVVLDHGDGVFTLYGRLATGTVPRGERVAVADLVGRLGETPEDEVPGLYFEIRDARASADPRLWLR